jgi:hypothetical protein
MGTDKVMIWAITDLLRGLGDPARPIGLGFAGETPNHRAMAAVAAYGWTRRYGTPSQRQQAESQVDELLRQQARAHCTWGAVDECLSPSHFNFWALSFAALAWLALETGDAPRAAAAATWWRGELALLALLSVPRGRLRGRIVAPGHRTFFQPGNPASGGSVTRDVSYALARGLHFNRKPEAWFAAAVDRQHPALDRAGAWCLLHLLRVQRDPLAGAAAAAAAALRGDLGALPPLRDTLRIVRTDEGHVGWFASLTGTGAQPAQYWAWCDYDRGLQDYGLVPTAEPPAPPGGWDGGWSIVIPGVG